MTEKSCNDSSVITTSVMGGRYLALDQTATNNNSVGKLVIPCNKLSLSAVCKHTVRLSQQQSKCR